MRLLKLSGFLALLVSIPAFAGVEGATNMHLRTVERTADSARMENVQTIVRDGQFRTVTNRYTQLAIGLHRMEDGNLVDADPTLVLQQGEAIGQNTRHSVKFSANINNWNGAIDLTAPDEARFLSRPALISYFDPATGESALIAELKDSVGVLFPPSKVVYENAFTDFKADLEYNNLLSGLQQNLIFRERPPEPAEFGLTNPVMIQILTEFFNAPVPVQKTQVREGVEDDRQLDFGIMKIGVGKSFLIGEGSHSWNVQKEWVVFQGRTFLIEQVPYARIAAQLNALPLPQQANNPRLKAVRHIASKSRLLPERQVATLKSAREIQVASVPLDQNGFVIDYSLVAGELTNFVFKADTTYFITNTVFLYGNTVLEGGAVVKYNGGMLILDGGAISCDTDAYRPAVFTSWEDDSVGEIIPGGSGIPTNGAACALVLYTSSNTELKHLRISYASQAVEFNATTTVSDCQIIKCEWGLMTLGFDLWLRNNLFYQCETALGVIEATIHGEHLTVNQSRDLVYEEWNSMHLRLTNTLLVAVTNLGIIDINATNSNFLWFTNDPGVFQTVGAGSHYLAASSPYRNVGTTNVSAVVRDRLATSTTFPPVLLTNSITQNITLSPAAEKDVSEPDLGYHYTPLDYVFGTTRINAATVTIRKGAAVGFFSRDGGWAACILECGAKLDSIGAPENLNKLVWYNTVQEQSVSDWSWNGSSIDILGFDNYFCAPVGLDCRFTQFSRMADGFSLIGVGDIGWDATFNLQNCIFSSGALCLSTPGGNEGYGWSLYTSMTNCLLFRSPLFAYSLCELFALNAVNNTFYGGSVYVASSESYSGTQFAQAMFRNNLFFTNTVTNFGVINVTHSHNAYVTNQGTGYSRIGTLAAGDVILTNPPAFQRGKLGHFYHPPNGPLYNAGNTNAHLLGLYHFTTATNQVKETNTFVDIGFHYVAVVAGVPADTDTDGLPDYTEDRNGNGIGESIETDWNDSDTDNDGVNDYIELLQGRNPFAANTVSDSSNLNRLRVFTPLK